MSQQFSMTASHAKGKSGDDLIFATSKEANLAAMKFGEENVVNATIGALFTDDKKLAILPTVDRLIRDLPAEEISAYAPIAGLPEFLDAAINLALGEDKPEAFIRAVATPGGSGSIRHTIWNYSEMGDKVLTSDWFWGPYKTIANENLRDIAIYKFFDEKDGFNLQDFEEKVNGLLKKQDSIVILLNSPAHNPTGFSLSDQEWSSVTEVLKKASASGEKRIILFVDVAYIDYAGTFAESRRFMKYFGNLSRNMLVVVAFSMSKGYTSYGLRSGAMIGISSSSEIAREFFETNQFSNRGVWSNGTRSAMRVLGDIYGNGDIRAKVEAEREELRKMLGNRASIFMEEARRSGLKICPYKAGFFISVPVENAMETWESLKKENIFAVPLKMGLRFAVCSIPTRQIGMIPEKVVKAMK